MFPLPGIYNNCIGLCNWGRTYPRLIAIESPYSPTPFPIVYNPRNHFSPDPQRP